MLKKIRSNWLASCIYLCLKRILNALEKIFEPIFWINFRKLNWPETISISVWVKRDIEHRYCSTLFSRYLTLKSKKKRERNCHAVSIHEMLPWRFNDFYVVIYLLEEGFYQFFSLLIRGNHILCKWSRKHIGSFGLC